VNTWKVILATMVIFGTGVVTGGLLVRHSEQMHLPRPPRNPVTARPTPPLSAGGVRLDFLRRAGRELELTPEQRERVDKLLKESQERTRKVMAPFMREELQRTREQFREVLTPAQRPRFDQLLKQQQHQQHQQQQQQQQQRSRDPHRSQPPAQTPAEAPPPSASNPP
jgi:hypothetical protein